MTTDLSERPRNPETLAGYGVFSSGICILEGTLIPGRVVLATLPVCAAHPRLESLFFKAPQHATPCPFHTGSPGLHNRLGQSAQGTPTHKSPWMLVLEMGPGSLSGHWLVCRACLAQLTAPGTRCLPCPSEEVLEACLSVCPVVTTWRLTDCQGPLRPLCVGN